MPRGRSARATRNSRLPQIVEMDGTLLEAYNHMDDLPRLSAEPKKRPRHVTRGTIAAERKAAAVAAAATALPTFTPAASPRVTRRNRAAAAAAAAAAIAAAAAAAHPKRSSKQLRPAQSSKLCCRVCLRSNSSLKIIRCSLCRKGVHTFCLNPPVMHLPPFGSWKCYKCKRKALALKTEKRTILRDALVSYPTLCTNSFVDKIIHTAVSVDAAAITPKLIPPVTINHVNVSPSNTHQLANGRTEAHAVASPTHPHSHHPPNPSHSIQLDQTVRAAIPFTRARHSTDQFSSLPAPVTDSTVVVRVPKELHLDQINPCAPNAPLQSSPLPASPPPPTQTERPSESNTSGAASPQTNVAPHPISIHHTRIVKPPTARRSQLPAPKKRKLRSNTDRNTMAQPSANHASTSKQNQSSLQPQSPKRTAHPHSSLVHSSAPVALCRAPPQSPARRRSHRERADTTASAPSRIPQMDSRARASGETASLPSLSQLHRSSLPLQKRYKYDIARSMEFAAQCTTTAEKATTASQSPRIQRERVTSLGANPRSSVMGEPRSVGDRPNRSSGKRITSSWNQTCAPQLRLRLSNEDKAAKTSEPLPLTSQIGRATGVRNEMQQQREEIFSQGASFFDAYTEVRRSRVLGSQEASKEAQTSQTVQRKNQYAKQSQAFNLGAVEVEDNRDVDTDDQEDGNLLSAMAPRSDNGVNFPKRTNSASAPLTGYERTMKPGASLAPRSARGHGLSSFAPNRDSDMRYRSALPSSEDGEEESLFPVLKPYLNSSLASPPVTAANPNSGRGKQTGGSGPTSGPRESFVGASTPNLIYPGAMERASDRPLTRPDSGGFIAPSRDGRSWEDVRGNDITPTQLNFEGNMRKDTPFITDVNAKTRGSDLESKRTLMESTLPVNSDSLPEMPVPSSDAVGSLGCDKTMPMMMSTEIPSRTGVERAASSRHKAMASRSIAGSINPADIENDATQTASRKPLQNRPVQQTNTASVNVKDLQWEAKREALMAFAQVQRKHQKGSTQAVSRMRGRDGPQVVRNVSRNRNVPETERHRMEITALAASSRFRYPNHVPNDAITSNKGAIRNLLQSTSELPSSGIILNANSQVNRGSFDQSLAGPTNYDSVHSFDQHRLSEDERNGDGHRRGANTYQGISTSRQRIYNSGQDRIYHSNSASFRGGDAHLSASKMTLPQQNSQMNTSYLQETPSGQMYESLQGNRSIHQRPPGVDAFGAEELRFGRKQSLMASTSPETRRRSSGGYGMQSTSNNMRNGSVQGLDINSRDPSRNRSQGGVGQRLPSASNLQLRRPEDRGPNRYQVFSNVPNHARLAPVSFPSGGLPPGSSSRTGTPMLEPMEMPPYGRPGDPIRYHDLPPTTYRRDATPVAIPPDRTGVRQDLGQRKSRVYRGRRVSNVEDVHQTLDRREIAPIREPFAQNDYLTASNQGNDVHVKDGAIGYLHVRASDDRRTLGNPAGSVTRPRRLTTPYVQPETRRAQFEQGKALAFVGTSQSRQGLNARRLNDVDLRAERAMLNGGSSQRRQRGSSISNAPELDVAALDYPDGYHVRRSRRQGSDSLGKNEFLGAAVNNTPRLGSLPDAGMSLSNQIRALVSQSPGKAAKTTKGAKQGDSLQGANGANKTTQAPSGDPCMPQSDSGRQTCTAAVPAIVAPLVTEQHSKDSDVVVSVTQSEAKPAVAKNTVERE